jgi:hypothetical protein
LRSADRSIAPSLPVCCRVLGVLLALGAVASSCSNKDQRSPASPDPSPRSFVGTWTGTITSQVVGQGAAIVVLSGQVESPATPLLSGTWSFVFPSGAFSGMGSVSGGLTADRTLLGLFFSRPVVPCPGEPGGAAEKTIAAILTVVGDRMQGDYIVGGCPGGTLDLIRN